jgi:DNA-binding winged helix-turn-helix (wHTH) protein/Tol biopolymer transport system component
VKVAVYHFGDYRLDLGRFELLRDDRAIRLERKPMELLILLLERDGELVTRSEIADRLWSSEVFVDTEHGINTAVRKIRYALGDDSENSFFVQTVTGKGYRFATPVLKTSAPEIPPAPEHTHLSSFRRGPAIWSLAGAACLLLALALTAFYRSRHHTPDVTYTQITDFTDSAVAPALSPDGRMLAFIRGGDAFLSADQIYVMTLPNGEARRLTSDNRLKYGLAFSPDGSQVAYTVLVSPGFSTYTVSILGGESHLLLPNSAGLVWLDQQRLLFSQIRSGIHLGVVSATATREGLREIYFPSHERAMAHYSYPSPDHHWAIVVEMNELGGWDPCKLISLDVNPAVRQVGPSGKCTAAGWSPDGSWMYFAATVEGQSHLWRQRFPQGGPEQLTFGPTEEKGLAVPLEGGSLITAVGIRTSSLWVHDPAGERPLLLDGEVASELTPPQFNSDSTILYYLLRHQQGSGAELWKTTLQTGQSEAVFPGTAVLAFDISPDEKHVVYTNAAPNGETQLWLAPIDRSTPAKKIGSNATSPHFGPGGTILFQQTEGNSNYLEQMNSDGSNHTRLAPYPISGIQGMSPGRRWVMAVVPQPPDGEGPAPMAIPTEGGVPRRICASFCTPVWSVDGKFLTVPVEASTNSSPGRSLAIPAGPGESLPDLPVGGISPEASPSSVRGARPIARDELVPGKDPDHFAYVNSIVHRNLYRISLP